MADAKARKAGRRWKVAALVVLGLLGAVGAGVALRWTELKTRYYLTRLQTAGEGEREAAAERLAEIGEPAIAGLIGCLREEDPDVCATAAYGLRRMVEGWGEGDPRCEELARELAGAYPGLSRDGQVGVLRLMTACRSAGVPGLDEVCAPLAREALRGPSVGHRIEGIRLAMWPELPLLPEVVPLLRDPEAEVRRAAMLALGPERLGGAADGTAADPSPAVSAEELLPFLHDADPEVRRLCEQSLRARGLSEQEIRLGERLTDPDPAQRLRLLVDLAADPEVDLNVWLERLSRDPDAAVRAGAARVASERGADLADRLEEMSRSDPHGTVRRIAEHYRRALADRKPR
ncbi:MAG TPA: hypothetical protein VIL46_09760 [Gemmataceae bacterium]